MRHFKIGSAFRLLAPLVVVAALVPAFASGVSATTKDSVHIIDCGKSSVRPTSIVVTCADANRYISSIVWQHWGTSASTAHGVLHWNDCSPTCVAGHWHLRAVTFDATTTRHRGSLVIYTQLHGKPSIWGESSTWWKLT